MLIGGVHQVAAGAVHAIRQAAPGMIQTNGGDREATDVERLAIDEVERRLRGQLIVGHGIEGILEDGRDP